MKISSLHNYRVTRWAILVLFVSYFSGISFFTHSHVVNSVRYVHSHPYKRGEEQKKPHSQNELILLDFFYHTTITNRVVPCYDLADHSVPRIIAYIGKTEDRVPLQRQNNTLLRAPPAA